MILKINKKNFLKNFSTSLLRFGFLKRTIIPFQPKINIRNQLFSFTPLVFQNSTEKTHLQDFKCKIQIIGVGGAGSNSVDNMLSLGQNTPNLNFLVVNTDAQALKRSSCSNKIQIGSKTTKGLGAGSIASIGQKSAQESLDQIMKEVEGTDLLFICCGMGGGTGTGASPVIASEAKRRGILTVGIVSTPFSFEGSKRAKIAVDGIKEMEKCVDTLIIIPNEHLFHVSSNETKATDAFKMIDDVLFEGVKSIIDLIITPGHVNLDFADVQTVMKGAGRAFIGIGTSDPEDKKTSAGKQAIIKALNNPFLDIDSIEQSTSVLLQISGPEITLEDVEDCAQTVKERVNDHTNIIVGTTIDANLKGIKVALIVTGIPKKIIQETINTEKKIMKQTEETKQPKKRFSFSQYLKQHWW